MQIAIVSDVHGNLPAFEAVLQELDRRGPFDAVIGGGDYAAAGAFPSECVTRTRELGWNGVRGNTDEWIVEAATDGRIPVDLEHVPPEMRRTGEGIPVLDSWAVKRLTGADIDFLAGLPLVWRTRGPSGQQLAFVHATPWSAHPGYAPDMSEADARMLLDEAEADAYLYGHIHNAYQRRVDGHLIGCVGAVGFSFDGDPRPCFAIATDEGDGWSLEHVRVDYDAESYVADMQRSEFPAVEEISRAVRTGRR